MGGQLPPLPLSVWRPCLMYSISRFFMKWREMSLEWNFSIFHELNFTENLFFAKTFSSLVRFYGHIIRHYFVTDVFPRFYEKIGYDGYYLFMCLGNTVQTIFCIVCSTFRPFCYYKTCSWDYHVSRIEGIVMSNYLLTKIAILKETKVFLLLFNSLLYIPNCLFSV